MTIGTALSIYLIGIIFLTIGIGVWARINSKLIDELDTIFFCTIIVSWPIGLCFATLYFPSSSFWSSQLGSWCSRVGIVVMELSTGGNPGRIRKSSIPMSRRMVFDLWRILQNELKLSFHIMYNIIVWKQKSQFGWKFATRLPQFVHSLLRSQNCLMVGSYLE